jgi:hypothetical protein
MLYETLDPEEVVRYALQIARHDYDTICSTKSLNEERMVSYALRNHSTTMGLCYMLYGIAQPGMGRVIYSVNQSTEGESGRMVARSRA